jgi:hypothetical protein
MDIQPVDKLEIQVLVDNVTDSRYILSKKLFHRQ